ncbi:MAG: MBL fold metallo-hydrolase [Chitinophagales bacterium]|nr:MBL fold metallo-hydrolase [Chitinophagaceae bacterium]MBP9881969.1 MBL fold metallo-hydrolase [Chitinophagales bacterium]
MQLYSIDTGYFKLDGGAMFGVVPKSIWNKINPADENNLCSWAMRCLLVEEGKRLVLIDCGMGNKQSEKFFSHYEPHGSKNLEASLHEFGFVADDITDVFLTHLHFDHCGGAIRFDELHKPVPAFRNATYYSCEKHWLTATKPNQREKASFLKENIIPIQESGQLKMLKEGDELFPGFKTIFVDGHTDAMMLPIIQYGNQTIAYMADLIPSAGHIPIPYVMAYDIRPLISLQEKETFLNMAYANNYSLFFEHDPKIELCNLVKTDRGIRMGEAITLQDL